MRSRIAEINLRFEELATAIETEKRALKPEEIEERDALVQEKEILQLRLSHEANVLTQQEISNERAFAQIVNAISTNSEIPEECRGIIINEGGKVGIEIPIDRAIQDTATATAVIPLTIGDIIEPLEKGLILHKSRKISIFITKRRH